MLAHWISKVCLAAAITVSASAAADARIRCNGSYQIVGGEEISTPYCSDTNLARFARERGMKVSDKDVLYNPNIKEEVCRLVGRSPRVSDACNSDSDSSKGK